MKPLCNIGKYKEKNLKVISTQNLCGEEKENLINIFDSNFQESSNKKDWLILFIIIIN